MPDAATRLISCENLDLSRVFDGEALRTKAKDLNINDYEQSYDNMLKGAALLRKHGGAANLTSLSMMAYGWMPTILKTPLPNAGIEWLADWADSMTRVDDVADSLSKGDISLPLVNNSWVGTSKFLHFYSPETFPIWDSVVASNWKLTRYRYEKKQAYADYCRVIGKLSANSQIKNLKHTLFSRPELTSDVRAVEFALFLLAYKSK